MAVLQHPHLLLQSLALPLQLLFPLTRPLGLVPRPLELRLQLLQLHVGQGVQAAGALKSQGRTVQHCEGGENADMKHIAFLLTNAAFFCQQSLCSSIWEWKSWLLPRAASFSLYLGDVIRVGMLVIQLCSVLEPEDTFISRLLLPPLLYTHTCSHGCTHTLRSLHYKIILSLIHAHERLLIDSDKQLTRWSSYTAFFPPLNMRAWCKCILLFIKVYHQ